MKKAVFSLFLLFFSLSVFANDKLRLILEWFVNPEHAPIFVAQYEGFFKQQGLDVQIIPPSNATDGPKLVAYGNADIAVSYPSSLLIERNRGMPLVRFASLIDQPISCLVADSDIKNLADLKGKRIGYSAPLSDMAVLSTMLKQARLTVQDVKPINVHYDLLKALVSHQVDAIIGVMRNIEGVQLKQMQFPVHIFLPEDYGIPPHDALIFETRTTELNNPVLKKFTKALTLATAYLRQHPEQCWQDFAKRHPDLNNPFNHAMWQASLPYFATNSGKLNAAHYQAYAEFLYQNHLIKAVPPLQSYAVGF